MDHRRHALPIPSLALATAVCALGATAPAHAWDPAEHIRFGDQIAEPFEERLFGGDIPVLAPASFEGPTTFGHWVSAPDYARGLQHFLDYDPILGPTACARGWAHFVSRQFEGIDDQALASEQEIEASGFSPEEAAALVDCLNVWAVNNSHFGDFARQHFLHYHRLALEAARIYRDTRQPECRRASYTLEAWAEHYLTDSTAIGHAWNPPGDFDNTYGWVTWTGLPIRRRIHHHLNGEGAHFADELHEHGIMLGDNSHLHDPLERTIPEIAEGFQWELTMRIARMALGQVVAAAECGADPEPWAMFHTEAPGTDARVFYVSNDDMCAAMYGREIWRWLPESANVLGLMWPELRELTLDCRAGRGRLSYGTTGAELASLYFSDRTHLDEGPQSSLTVDPELQISLDQLNCYPDAVPYEVTEDDEIDLCGQRVCDSTPTPSGDCPPGEVASAGCCVPRQPGGPGEHLDARVTRWVRLRGEVVPLPARAAVRGGPADLLWTSPPEEDEPPTSPGAWAPVEVAFDAVELGGAAPAVVECQREAQVEWFETFVDVRTMDEGLWLVVEGMDDGVRIAVDGHVVEHVVYDAESGRPSSATVPLVHAAAEPGLHRVRVAHVNDCGDARPLRVRLSNNDKADGPGEAGAGAAACSASGVAPTGSPWSAALLALVVLARALRRRGKKAFT